MTSPRLPIDVDDLAHRYLAGESTKQLARDLGINEKTVVNRLDEAGIPRTLRKKTLIPDSEIVRRYLAGESEKALSVAAGVERSGTRNTSEGERYLAGLLYDRGVTTIPQKAIGPYNVDLAAGTVAVEVLGGHWHRAKKHGQRLRYLLDGGWDVVYVWSTLGRPLGPGAAEYVVSHLEFRDRNPSAARCYRVIRGGGESVAGGEVNRDEIPDVVPLSSRPRVAPDSVPYGFCHCGCGGMTTVWVRGEPKRFISGHNNTSRTR